MHSGGLEEEIHLNEDRRDQLSILRLPHYIADPWLNQPPGTMVGVLQTTGRQQRLLVSKDHGCPVKALNARQDGLVVAAHEVVITGDTTDFCAQNKHLQIWNQPRSAQAFFPDASDKDYQAFLMGSVNNLAPPPAKQAKLLPSVPKQTAQSSRSPNDDEQGTADSRMFEYYRGDPNAGPVSAHSLQRAQEGAIEEAQAALFRLFEMKLSQNAPVTLRDIQQAIHLPHHQLRKLLDQMVEPQKDRLGRNTIFVLKGQYQHM